MFWKVMQVMVPSSIVALLATASAVQLPGSFGRRGPTRAPADDDCTFGGLCAGPTGGVYAVAPGIALEAVFTVPPLPAAFDLSMTYYDYFNIFFDRAYAPPGAKFNQFVPQLMLGTALANSSGPPAYAPQWLPLSSWHFGAQYFMGFDDAPADDPDAWSDAAATGALHAVAPGERVRTTFALSDDGEAWTLRMAVDGDDRRVSTVVAARPFMGLLNTTSSWREYNATTVGSCWENYGMVDASSYPPSWHEVHAINATAPGGFWSEWSTSQGGTCPSAPRATVTSAVSVDGTSQSATWDITVPGA